MRTGPLDDPLLWTMEETARQCAVSRRTVQRWVNDGSLPVVRFGCRATRIPSAAVRAFIARRARSSIPAPISLEPQSCAAQELANIIKFQRKTKRR